MQKRQGYQTTRGAIIALLLESGALSRAEIARRTSLSRATISLVMAELMAEGVVQEVGTDTSTGGRRPILVRLGGDARYVIGVAIEDRQTLACLVDLDGRIVDSVELAVPVPGNPESVVEVAREGVRHLMASRQDCQLLATGISLSGQANARSTTFSSGIWDFEHVPLQSMLEAEIGCPAVAFDNAHAAALGELWQRGREHRAHLVYLYMGNGVGGAIITERSLYTGANQAAGEVGAVIIDPNGPHFPCHRGCFEGFVSYSHLRQLIREQVTDGATTTLPDALSDGSLLAELARASARNDPVAVDVVRYAARYTGLIVGNLIDILNPDEVIIGGEYARLGAPFVDLVAEHAGQTALPGSYGPVTILAGGPVLNAAALGAAAGALTLAPRLLGASTAHA